MKIIKSIPTIIVCLFATSLLHAQEVKTQVLKQPEAKMPPQAPNNKPSPQPEFKPQVAGEKPVAAETPKSLVSEDEAKPQEKDKPTMKVAEPKTNTTPGGEQGKKIMAGQAEKPKQSSVTPNTTDQNPMALPPGRQAAVKQY